MVRGFVIYFVASIVALAASLEADAQSNKGTITPVDSDDDAPRKPVLHYYDKHGEKLETPVLYLAELDTAKSVRPSSPYPFYNGFTVGVNFGDAIFSLLGQKHYSYDVNAMISLHNWFFPVVEAGIGWGDHTEKGGLYHVKAKPSFYGKVGLNYNFLYKSKPDYMAYLGLRFGFSRNSWDVTETKSVETDSGDAGGDSGDGEVSVKSESQDTEQITTFSSENCTSIFGEIVAGLKVKIAGPFSLGWSVRYRLGLHNSHNAAPWFVAGYGTGGLAVSVNAYLSFGERPRRDAVALPEDIPVPDPSSQDASPSDPSDDLHAQTKKI